MQNETITIGFVDGEPRVYVNGELRKSTLDVTWDESSAFLLGLVVGLTIAFLTAVLFEIHVKRKSVTPASPQA